MRLNQVVAIANGEKTRRNTGITGIYHTIQREGVMDGFTRRYEPFEDDPTGQNRLPGEDKIVQYTYQHAIEAARKVTEEMLNIVATQDISNCEAKADIKIDEVVIAKAVPITHLLFLEKQLIDLNTFVEMIPILDPAEDWEWDDVAACYKTKTKETIRTKKVPKNHVKAVATDKHPAQVEIYHEDIPVGKWLMVKFSGAIRKVDRDNMLTKIRALDKAIKLAREEANAIEVKKSDIGSKILDYVFAGN